MGRDKFSKQEINEIARLLHLKNAGSRFKQKEIRHRLRVDYGFNISDFNVQGKAFDEDDLTLAVKRGAIRILDDATIADMKAKLARAKERDAALRRETEQPGETTDWEEALKEWREWEDSQPSKP